jgi:protein-tyrosine phosphatase
MPDDTPACEPPPAPREPFITYRVCLVCLGNICRSPIAEVVLKEELARAGLAGTVEVDSAGTGDWHVGERMYGPARAELERHGYDGSRHRARQIQEEWLAGYDLVLAMDQANLADLREMAPDSGTAARVRLLRSFDPALTAADPYDGAVPDPYGGPTEGYTLAFGLVLAAAKGLTGMLAGLLDVPARGRA